MPNLTHTFQGMKKLVHEGQVMILFAVASLVLIGAVALAVDVGFLLAERRQVQAAADSAAMAAAQSGLDNKTAQIVSAGKSYGSLNASVAVSAVDVNPNASGPSGGEGERYVEVTIVKEVQKFFLGAIYTGAWSVTASAMAAVEPIEADYALITLDPVSTPGVLLKGGGNSGGIYITGDNGSAVSNSTMEGTKKTTFEVAGAIHAFGSISEGDDWVAPMGIRADRNRLVDDPLLTLTPPPKGESQTFPEGNCKPCTVEPGWYRDQDIKIQGTATFKPGSYFFENATIQLQGANARIQGNGVSLYFAANSSLDAGTGDVNVSAISTAEEDDVADYRDVAFWYAACSTLELKGHGGMKFEGIFYAPCANVWMHGTPGAETIRGQIVVGTLDARGNAALGIAYESRVETFQPSVFLIN